MTDPTPATPAPGAVVFLGVVAGLWVVGGVWSAVTMLPDVTGVFLCGLGATTAAGAAAIVYQLAQRHTTEAQ